PDHTQGNQRYVGAFPTDVTVVSHEATREDVATLGARRLAADLERLPREIASLESQLAGLAGAGAARAREVLQRQRGFLAELRSVEPVLPSVTFDRALTLYRGAREIQLLYVGRGHTRGDLVVYLPRERIAFVGDLVTGGPPFARDGYPIAWAETLDRLARLDIATVVPGHGRVRHDAGVLRDRARFLRQAAARIERGRAAGESVDEMSAAIDLDSFRDTFDPEPADRPWRGWMRMLVERTLDERR
ncbi:MAG: MBL fold metallo-hydrolase, partial [Acidobacteriota bacterium]|nr:MBL fold metallo-hydrolase [Acidobacteriota bacterium]